MGSFTPWEDIPPDTDCLFYEGLHGAVITDTVNTCQHADVLIGVAPTTNLEWIQKIHRDTRTRGYSSRPCRNHPAPHDYVHYIVPQFFPHRHQLPARPDGGHLQPLRGRDIPTADESKVIIRFRNPRGRLPYLLSMIHGASCPAPTPSWCPAASSTWRCS